MLISRMCAIAGWLIASSAGAQSTPATSTSTASAAQSTACGYIVNSGQYVFSASVVYECMTSVPFNAAVATRFIAYYNDTLQFQSTLAYHKNPPPSYQQAGVDLIGNLRRLQQNIDEGLYNSQYDFETDLLRLVQSAHDSHLTLDAGVLAAFVFASPRDIVSVSLDGTSLPKVYLSDDLFDSNFFTSFQPSALQSINGVDAVTYLKQFAANNSFGTLETHADWNQLMQSPALDILGYYDVFSGGATFYPGDTVTWTFENGTSRTEDFSGIYLSQGPTGPLETGGDFYNFFVLGFYPAGFDPYSDDGDFDDGDDSSGSNESSATSSSISSPSTTTPQPTATTTPSGWDNLAYPDNPDVAQPDLSTTGGGYLSGYFLRDSSIAVLSIPSFDEYGDAINSFQTTVQAFIQQARAAGMKKVVVDVQQNVGGQPLLAIDAFQRFFPNIKPFAGSRMRAHYAADVMGSTDTGFWDSLTTDDPYHEALLTNEWVVTDRIDAVTGQYFHSWAEFYGPNKYNDDDFTNVQQYNTSNADFNYESTDEATNFTIPSPVANASPPFAASDIVILSDGICDSSCALFMELMHHEAGVHTIAVGGLPNGGPMQAPSGSRGAREYDISVLDSNIDFAQTILQSLDSPNATFLPNRTEANDMFILGASINLRDQVRRGQTTPLQFAYLPADCRIYYTPQTVYNYTKLWEHAAAATWTNTSLCVPGSTGHADSVSTGPDSSRSNITSAPDFSSGASNHATIPANLIEPDALLADGAKSRVAYPTTKATSCDPKKGCGTNMACEQRQSCQTATPSYVCVSTCWNINEQCTDTFGQGRCRASSKTGTKIGSQDMYAGTCVVPPPRCPGQSKAYHGPPPRP
ncbi:hypothetical protein F4680DRAFT_426408 [Xylaria scruposa]|nr:hypothetical protein F4680DRAFT_426408 [Xylaria scruposa]